MGDSGKELSPNEKLKEIRKKNWKQKNIKKWCTKIKI
jgi:hypothetical protein